MSTSISSNEYRASNGIFYRVEGEGEPLLLLHGLMVTGRMFDPLIELLRSRFRMLVPDLRGHGKSGDLAGPYDVAALAADLDAVMAESGLDRAAVLGYSHGGAVAQQFAHTRPASVGKLTLACTYACNVATTKERIEASVLVTLLRFVSPGTLGKLMIREAERRKSTDAIAITKEQAGWMGSLMAVNRAAPMRGAARGLITFDSRPWLNELKVPTVVVGAMHDAALPRYHFDMLVKGIPGARGRLLERAGHTLMWTHTKELAEIMCAQ